MVFTSDRILITSTSVCTFVCESNCFKFILGEFRRGSQSYKRETRLKKKFQILKQREKNAVIVLVEDVIGGTAVGLFQQSAAY